MRPIGGGSKASSGWDNALLHHPHFDGHNSVLVQASRLGEITRQELAELVQDAWLAQASARRRAAWLAAHGSTSISDPDPTDSELRTLLIARQSGSRSSGRPHGRRK